MKSCVRIGSLIIALGLAGLLAGCVSDGAKTSRRARDFEIVETSTKRQLTPKEMVQLQAMVGDYLQKEGVKEGGDYYVKVYLTPDKDGLPGEWVVVRYSQPTAYTATHFSLLSSYPDYGYSSYYPRYNFDYYPFGWIGGSAFALSYFDDPFYYYGYGYNGYYPRRTYTNYHGRNRDGDRDRDHDRDRNRPPGDNRPSGGLKPSYSPSGGNLAPGYGYPSSGDTRLTGNDSNGRNDSRQRWRSNNNSSPTAVGTGTPYTPTYRPPAQSVAGSDVPAGPIERPTRTYDRRERHNPESNRSGQGNESSSGRQFRGQERSTPAPSSNLPVKPSHDTQRRETSRQVQSSNYTPPAPRQESRQESSPAPSYTPPAARSESSENTRSGRGDGSHDAGRRARAE